MQHKQRTESGMTKLAAVRGMDSILAANAGSRVEVVQVTPGMAQAWLEKNTKNRPVNDDRVEAYVRDMKGGKWVLCPDAVAFGADDVLLNGQHRLWAVFNSGCTVPLLVAWGVPEEARGVTDLGQKRSAGQNYALLTGEKAAKKKMEVGNFIRRLVTNDSSSPTYAEAVANVEKYATAIDWALAVASPPGKLRSAWLRGALAFAWKTNPAAVAEFAEQLVTGSGLSDGDPALIMRNKLMMSELGDGSSNRRRMAVCLLRAVFAHLQGEKMRALYATEDAVAFFGKAWDLRIKGSSSRGEAGAGLVHHAKSKARKKA